MNIKIIDKNGVTLKTKGKYCKEDISVSVDESILGVTPTGTYQVTDNGEYDITEYAKVNVNVAGSGEGNTLKKLLDYTKSMYYMFANNNNITDLTDYLSYSDSENVTNMTRMCYDANLLITIPQIDTSNVTKLESTYEGCYKLKSKLKLNTNKVTHFGSTFKYCYELEEIDISHYNISSGSSASAMCQSCHSLKRLIIRSFGSKYALNGNSLYLCYHLKGTVDATYNPTGAKDGFIYVPKNMCDTLKSATNWSAYADQIRALEDYTVDGTTTGDLDESKI